MLKNKLDPQLKDIYRLFQRVRSTLDFIANIYKKYIDDNGELFNNISNNKKENAD